jgi:hypothetical protein
MPNESLTTTLTGAITPIRAELEAELRWARAVEPALERLCAEDLTIPARQWEPEVWAAVVRSYRVCTQRLWGPVLLAMIAPHLDAALNRLHPIPALNNDDLCQEIVLQVLEIAASSTLPADPRWIPLHLVRRAVRMVARRLGTEQRQRALSLEGLDTSGELAYRTAAVTRRGRRPKSLDKPGPDGKARQPDPEDARQPASDRDRSTAANSAAGLRSDVAGAGQEPKPAEAAEFEPDNDVRSAYA